MTTKHETYYVPAQSVWPIIGAIGLFLIAFGAGNFVQQLKSGASGGGYILLAGIAVILFMLVGWFRTVINESTTGLYSHQMDRSFRQGMSWFIFSEVMFFGAFFWGVVLCPHGRCTLARWRLE
ncbi:cytochrome c oxidase polypeptide III [Shewanella sp. HN-41]|nr:cytochrome c oxidase polypeptide III [Shewanella sp. HN-41]